MAYGVRRLGHPTYGRRQAARESFHDGAKRLEITNS